MKKKELLISMEKERFNKNMAQLMQSYQGKEEEKESSTVTDAKGRGSSKWAAIRGYIQQTMERRPLIEDTSKQCDESFMLANRGISIAKMH